MTATASSSPMVAYWEPKAGTARSEWEDGVAYDSASGWFAVADGASTGSNSREWAYTLTNTFVGDGDVTVLDDDGVFATWLDATRLRFDPDDPAFPRSRMPEWVKTAGERTGAHATFVGGHLDGREVRAVAVGDCCLFHLRHGADDPTAFPIDDVGRFGSCPVLVGSLRGSDDALFGNVRRYHSPVAPGDVLLAASDALAEWLVRGLRDPAVWRAVSTIGHESFGRLCRDLRAAGQMKNDDVTMWRCRVGPSGRP